MLIPYCKAKIHRATVTEANLNYVGSITIDEDLLDASGIKPYQYLNITSLANGTFWRTYAIPGKRGEGAICLNGSPAHHFKPGDLVIILAEVLLTPEETAGFETKVVFVDEKNKITGTQGHDDVPHPLR